MSARRGTCSILHVIPKDGVGGVETAARSMLSLEDIDCSFGLLVIAGEGAEDASPDLISSPFRAALNPLAQLRAVLRIRRARPDVLICSLWRSVPAALLARLLLPRTRLAFFLHSELVVHRPDRLLSSLAIRWADEIWSDSEATLKRRQIPAEKPRRVISFLTQHRAPARAYQAPAAASFVIWARLSPEKSLDRSIRFIADLHRQGIDARFDIWGPDAGSRAELVALVDRLGLAERVRFRGPAEQAALPGIAAEHSFYLQLSRFEGMAMSVVEAMQLGLVPVTTAVGEMKSYVMPGRTGIIVDPDHPGEAIAAIRQLLGDETAYAALRTNAIAHWQQAPTYGEDVRAAANALARRDAGASQQIEAAASCEVLVETDRRH